MKLLVYVGESHIGLQAILELSTVAELGESADLPGHMFLF